MGAAVEVRPEVDTVFVNLPALGKAEDLISTAIGQDRFVPANEFVEAAAARDQFVARPQHQMVGVAKNDAGADLLKVLRSQAFNRALGADRHEHRRLDVATRCLEDPSTRASICVGEREQKIPGPFIIAE